MVNAMVGGRSLKSTNVLQSVYKNGVQWYSTVFISTVHFSQSGAPRTSRSFPVDIVSIHDARNRPVEVELHNVNVIPLVDDDVNGKTHCGNNVIHSKQPFDRPVPII
jgi:hypothetical protein